MGNCMALNNNVSILQEEKTPPPSPSPSPSPVAEDIRGTSFPFPREEVVAAAAVKGRLEDVGGKGNGGVVRLRIVVTQQELNQILNYKTQYSSFNSKSRSSSSIEHFLNAMKESGRMIPEVRTAGGTSQDTVVLGGWKPALETIPEDHY